ncbi:dicarboxylate/amino acid:cation symporter [Acetobacter persici]|uniref:C4-dicarboxylate transport protein n=1 Tax=Acetobacter persici TaxID=1076596 RepID=A0A6V8I3T2_9PROT|nr:dicarboxylate/amino acid:cation symporter [Acetobacter persici]OUI91932.1 C4-dicarboxylate transporter [Acetobacter persici]GFE92223.1 C4-dicarboxylate transport protein [Acetobacter persici]
MALPDPTSSAHSGSSRAHLFYIQVIIAVIAGILVGYFFPNLGASLRPLGDGFVKLIKMVIAPVIFLTVCTGIAGMADLKQTGRVAGKAMAYFLCFSTLALIVGMLVANIARPGAGLHIKPASLDSGAVATFVSEAHSHSFTEFLMRIIPSTTAGAFTSGEILQVLLIAILFGISLAQMGESGQKVLSLFRNLTELVFGVVRLVMYVAPIGAFGAMAFTVGKFGVASIGHLLALVLAFYLTAILFVCGVLGVVTRMMGISIFRLLGYIKEELLIVLGTSSSESALPGLISKLEKAGCPQGIVGLVVPMGYSFNLDGTNIYMTLAALFIAQATDVHLGLGEQLALLLVAMVSSKGAAGVTGAGFITLAATLSVVPSVPVGGMALILGIDRFMSECRSLTNLVGNAVAALVISRWENALDEEQLHAALNDRPHA